MKLNLFIIAIIFSSVLHASGSMAGLRPRRIKFTYDASKVEQGKLLLNKKSNQKKSCMTCHSKKSKVPFNRRGLARKLKNIKKNIIICCNKKDRMSKGFLDSLTKKDIESIQQYLAKEHGLGKYLR
ncbi:MAG: hypothetical protein COB02_12920 [Candidatus Cloacimonadota bacterium]|nr:MAG: hypothetical protein COB02_12920 [Candidatus Cloacimonadota bacterium]